MIEFQNVSFAYPDSADSVLKNISLVIPDGQCVLLCGRSGCGKTTLTRLINGLIPQFFEGNSSGEIGLNGENLADLPMYRIAEKVGLNTTYLKRYPHAFSGGQRQRIGTARALILKPQVIVCDEAVSALDVSIQAQIINLLKELQQEMDLTYIFISHDLSVVEHISDKVGVMYLGRLVEFAETEALFSHPLHPYTEALLSAVPVADPDVKNERIPLEGEIPNPANPPSGCYFHERCRYCQQRCVDEAPELTEVEPGRQVACHFAGELHLRGFDYEKE